MIALLKQKSKVKIERKPRKTFEIAEFIKRIRDKSPDRPKTSQINSAQNL